jgi:aryl-alcohol dehydrogenase-like predicted oxidoreductase
LSKRIVLGTVQLGIDYGINNSKGKPGQEQSYQILQQAQESGIELLDSAEAYGDSLSVVGSFMKSANGRFKVISKFVGDHTPLATKVEKTLEDINSQSLYAYLYHRFDDYSSGNYRQQIVRLKEQGKIERIGVSLYGLDQLKKVVDDTTIDLIQVPLNVFDVEDGKRDLLENARRRGKEVHVRSVFLQGLFFKDPQTLTGTLIAMKQPLQELFAIVKDYDMDIRTVCLSFALAQPFVDRVIIGVDSKEQLIENLRSERSTLPKGLIEKITKIQIPDRSLLNPSSWKL